MRVVSIHFITFSFSSVRTKLSGGIKLFAAYLIFKHLADEVSEADKVRKSARWDFIKSFLRFVKKFFSSSGFERLFSSSSDVGRNISGL